MPERDEVPDYLALERTYLAWVRTGLAAMGFGFVVARFGLFLRELQPAAASGSTSWSVWFGTALIVMGVVANLLCAWSHRQLVQALDRGEMPRARPVAAYVLVALILALVGIAMAVYLVMFERGSAAHSAATGEGSMEATIDNGIARM